MVVSLLSQLPPFFTNGTFAVLLLITGLAIGLTLGRRLASNELPNQGDLKRLVGVLTHLVDWTHGMADDVSEYRSVVNGVSDLFRGNEEMDESKRAATAGIMSQVVEANERLQDRLNEAEKTLKDQASEISTYMSEARTDVLTGLPNRRALDEDLARQMSQWKRHARPVSVLMIDIDHFKKFNDTYGHQAGDAVLQQVAGLLRKTMREADLVGRFGGEEFSAILPSTDATEACRAAERARTAIHTATFTHEGEMLHVSVSIGAAQCLECEEADAFVKRADAALYTAKQAGRNRAYWHDGRECRCVSGAGTGKQAFAKSMPVQQPVTCDEEEMSVASFAAVCQDLRRRLEEVTSSDASQSGVDRGRVRASNHQPHCEHI